MNRQIGACHDEERHALRRNNHQPRAKVGNGTYIGAGCVVMTDVAPDTTLEVAPPEFAQRKSRHA